MRKMDGSETLRQAIQFCYDCDTVITGLDIQNPTNGKALITRLLSGAALTHFNSGYNDAREGEHRRLRVRAYELAISNNETEAAAQLAMDAIGRPGDHANFLLAGVQAIVTYVAP